jgi:hypothetical protein
MPVPCITVNKEAKKSGKPIVPVTRKALTPLQIAKLRRQETELERLLNEVCEKYQPKK